MHPTRNGVLTCVHLLTVRGPDERGAVDHRDRLVDDAVGHDCWSWELDDLQEVLAWTWSQYLDVAFFLAGSGLSQWVHLLILKGV
jgi:hypothetical protein